MMTNKAVIIQDYLNEILPNVKGELQYNKDYELLIAVILSAQATDKSVNLVTPVLFAKFPTLEDLANGDLKEIEDTIKSIGLYKNKAKNIKELARILVEQYDGKVPHEKEVLVTLPGVGNKTASVTRLELWNEDEFPVDTHVTRVSIRLGLANKNDDVLTIERKLKKIFSKENWGHLHHQFIHFGRYFCKAQNPNCKNCKIIDICKENKAKR